MKTNHDCWLLGRQMVICEPLMTIDHDMEFETILEIVPYSGSDEEGIEEYDGAAEWAISISEY